MTVDEIMEVFEKYAEKTMVADFLKLSYCPPDTAKRWAKSVVAKIRAALEAKEAEIAALHKSVDEVETQLYERCQLMGESVSRYENEIAALKAVQARLAESIHYPVHWDIATYPTLQSALCEIGCSECYIKDKS